MLRKALSLLVLLSLVFQQTGFAQVGVAELNMSGYFSNMSRSAVQDSFRPVHIRFFSYDTGSDNFRVMLDKGDLKDLKEGQAQEFSQELLNYFLIGVALPNDSFWVNLQPTSEDKIIDPQLARTDVGKIMLEADLQLKKDVAALTSPQTKEGREYWNRLYNKVSELYGYEQATISTLNRPWIVPNEIIVRESNDSAYIYKATLKVMLEQDYLKDSAEYNFKDPRAKALNEYSAQLMRELVIPKLTKEVNLSKKYAAVRQVYYSIIFSRWFKTRFAGENTKHSSQIDRGDISGFISKSAWSKATYFDAYKKSFAEGEYNIKEPVNTPTGQVIRTYFSGGLDLRDSAVRLSGVKTISSPLENILGDAGLIPVGFNLGDNSGDSGVVSSPLKLRSLDDLKAIITGKGIKSGIFSVDWNLPLDEQGSISDNQRIVDSMDTLKWGLDNLRFLYVMTHSGRPTGQGFEAEASLRPMAEEAARLLRENGVTDAEVVLLPYDFSEARLVISRKKAEALRSGGKVLFVLENIRMYPGEQSKDPAVREVFEKDIVSLTSENPDNLVYVVEAFDKAHRAEEASMEMGHLLFPETQRAAGIKLAEESEKVLEFLAGVKGRLSVIAGGAKFDKLKTFGSDLAGRVANSGGQLIFVGALANPVLADSGVSIGKSLMPKAADEKATKDALKKIRDTKRDKKLQVITPSDFVVKNGLAVKDTLEGDDEQVDIGPKTISQIVAYIDSLTQGDGLVLNGGAGVFDKSWGSKTGTVAIVGAASRAADRGVAVFFAGGDMNNAANIAEEAIRVEVPGWSLNSDIYRSTGGGALLTALGKGVGNLIPVRAVMQFEDAQPVLLNILSAITDAFPDALLRPTLRTKYEDTSTGDDANRRPALDLSTTAQGGREIAIPDGRRSDAIKLFYETAFMPVVVLAEDVPDGLQGELAAAKKEKDVTAFAQKVVRAALVNRGVPVQDTQERSHLLDPGKLDAAAVDIATLVAIRTRQGDLFMYVPILIRRGQEQANQTLNQAINDESRPKIAARQKDHLSWPEDITVSDHAHALAFLEDYAPLFFDTLSQGDLSKVGVLTDIVNQLDPTAMVNPQDQGVVYDKQIGTFISEKDLSDPKAPAPGFGKSLERFRGSLYKVGETALRLHYLLMPGFDSNKESGVAVNDKNLQDAAINFYSRMYRYLLNLASEYFKNARVFDSLRGEIGNYAQRLNKALRSTDALELSSAEPIDIIMHLESKGVTLSNAEKDNIYAAYDYFKQNKDGFFDILQLAGLLREKTFVVSFRNLKLDTPRQVLPSEKPFEAYDGSGRIGRMAWALRLANDVNAGEDGYIGRYMIASQKLEGSTQQDKFTSALAKANEMLSDQQIEDSKLGIRLANGQSAPLAELIWEGRITFKAADNVLAAQLDFQDNDRINSVYAVNIYLDTNLIGVAYFVDIAEFESGMLQALKDTGRSLDNIPRPFIVVDDTDTGYYFGLRIDATPGGVEIGDQQLEAAGKKGEWKPSGPTLWRLLCKNNLPEDVSKPGLGTAADELARIRAIYDQVNQARLPPEGGQSFIYNKAQIPKTMILPGFNSLGRHIGWAIPFIQKDGMMYITPGSCSTNGGSHAIAAFSAFAGGVDSLGPTIHMYTSSDKGKYPYGHTANKSTGAAKGVALLLYTGEGGQTFFTAERSPTALIDGETEIVGGSMFDLLVRFPTNVSEATVRKFIARMAAEFPHDLKFFTEGDKTDGRYTWKNTIAGQKTGSILYDGYIEQFAPGVFRVKIGYDNEMSFSSKQKEVQEGAYLDRVRNRQIAKMAEIAPLANTASSPVVSGRQEYRDFDSTEPVITLADRDGEWQRQGDEYVNVETGRAIPAAEVDGLRRSQSAKRGSSGSSPATNDRVGGIDFRAKAMNIKYEPMGDFASLKINLPNLSQAELNSFDTEGELSRLERMVENELLPSGQRVKDILAASVQRGEWDLVRERMKVLLVKMGLLEERISCDRDSDTEYKEALVVADSLQG